jgi:hypothetical protein
VGHLRSMIVQRRWSGGSGWRAAAVGVPANHVAAAARTVGWPRTVCPGRGSAAPCPARRTAPSRAASRRSDAHWPPSATSRPGCTAARRPHAAISSFWPLAHAAPTGPGRTHWRLHLQSPHSSGLSWAQQQACADAPCVAVERVVYGGSGEGRAVRSVVSRSLYREAVYH